MIRIRELKLPLMHDEELIRRMAADRLRLQADDIRSIRLHKKSVDARRRGEPHFTISVDVECHDEAAVMRALKKDVSVVAVEAYVYQAPERRSFSKRPVVVGSGPGGLFAALTLARAGARPIVLERGQDVDSRAVAVERFWKGGELDPECNAQFGEGGAGTFSDGKLTTGTKDPRIAHVFSVLMESGAPDEIGFLAKPHIGTDYLRRTVKALRSEIEELGGEFIFSARFCDFTVTNGAVRTINYIKGGIQYGVETEHVILAVGHSARDAFALLEGKGVRLEQKPFSVGLRIEHRQSDIDHAMYGDFAGHPALPPAEYKLAAQLPGGRGVYSFCMCPGGRVVAAASEPEGLVTNGMSFFVRGESNANAALLVSVGPKDFAGNGPLDGVAFQQRLERAAYAAGGGGFYAPAVNVGDFLADARPGELRGVPPSYKPGVTPARPEEYLPLYVCEALKEGIRAFGKKAPGYDESDALLTGVESRSSSPVRIVRNADCMSVSVKGLYPCGEGAGYAGGIVSAAVDGIRCAESVLTQT